jgi:hypothetical protein
MIRKLVTPVAATLLLAGAFLGAAAAAEPPMELKWAQLVPSAPPPALKPKAFFSGAAKIGDDSGPPPPPMQEGQFMSVKRRQPGGDQPPAVVAELNGKHVKIGGYVVPLDFEATSVKEFLLVPFVGACIHVPPPPANQIIYVKAAKPFSISGAFDPVSVVGKLQTETAFTGLADAGYTLEAEAVDVIKP